MWGYGGGDVLAVDAKAAEEAATDEVARDRTADDVQTLPAPTDDERRPDDHPSRSWRRWSTSRPICGGSGTPTAPSGCSPPTRSPTSNGNAFTVPAVTDEFMIVVERRRSSRSPNRSPPSRSIRSSSTRRPRATSSAPPVPTGVLDEFVGMSAGRVRGDGQAIRVHRSGSPVRTASTCRRRWTTPIHASTSPSRVTSHRHRLPAIRICHRLG